MLSTMNQKLITYAIVLALFQSCAQTEDLIPELKQKPTKSVLAANNNFVDLRDTPTCQAPLNFVDFKESQGFSASGAVDCDFTNNTILYWPHREDYLKLEMSDPVGNGRLRIILNGKAKTGIFTTSSSNWVDPDEIFINTGISFSNGYDVLPSQKVFVEVNESLKTIRVKFCDLLIYRSPNSSGGYHEASITGDIRGTY
jgi:hypothetical protein